MNVIAYVCRKCGGGRRLGAHVEERTDASVRLVGCQKICTDHVVGVGHPDAGIVWFERVDSKPRRRALREYVADGPNVPLPKPLRRLVVGKRADRLR